MPFQTWTYFASLRHFWLKKIDANINNATMHPVLLAAEMHERVVTIHPFIDGNGRTSRLVMNLILLQHGYPIANIPGDTDSRLAYYSALEQANAGDKMSFHRLIANYVLVAARHWVRVVGGWWCVGSSDYILRPRRVADFF